MKRVICKTWTGILKNNADPDQSPRNAASDQGLHCLLKLQEVNSYMKQFKTSLRTIFPAYTLRNRATISVSALLAELTSTECVLISN